MILMKRLNLVKDSIFKVFFVFLIFLFTFTLRVEAAVSGPEVFLGEKLNYNVGFWLFSKAAVGSFSFKKHQKGYEAIFEAQTAGFLKLITGKKIEYMRSVMEYDSEKKMFRTLIFEETFKDGASEAKKEIFYDYGKRVYEVSFFRDGEKVKSIKKSMPDGPFADLLTFFYNLRNGYYGKVGAGMELSVCALVNATPSYIRVAVDKVGNLKKGTKYLFVFSVDKKISAADSDRVLSWFSEELIPVYSVIKDAYYFGDLRIRLIK
jgi:hypothetical protein